jgi:hypothetical protein
MPQINVVSMEPLKIDYDFETDVVTIEGIRYAGGLFRGLGIGGLEPGTALRIVNRDDGVLTVEQLREVKS